MARKPAFAFIFVTLVIDVMGIGLIVPILPKLVEEMHGAGVTEGAYIYGLLVALYSLMQFIFAPLIGSLSDRFGRRSVILTSLLGSGLDYFLLAFAPNLVWFFVGRIIAGITGANFAAATAYIADISPPEKRAANFGLLGAAFGLGFIIGPALGGILGEIGLRVPFFAAGFITLLNWAYGLFILPESLPKENRRKFSWARSNPVGSLLDLRRYPMVFGLTGTYFLINVAHQVFPSIWVLYTTHRFHWSEMEIGFSLAAVGVMAALVQGGLIRIVIPKIGEKNAAIYGLIISIISFVFYGLVTHGWMIYLVIIFGSLGGIAGPALQGLISRTVGADEQGGVQGSLTSLASVAGVIGPPVATGLFGYFISKAAPFHLPAAAFYFSAFLVLIATLLAVRACRKVPTRVEKVLSPQPNDQDAA